MLFYRTMSRVILFPADFRKCRGAEHWRDDWKIKPFDLDGHLTHTLAGAPLSISEREQIYNLVSEAIHSPVGDSETIMNFYLGSIATEASKSWSVEPAHSAEPRGTAPCGFLFAGLVDCSSP